MDMKKSRVGNGRVRDRVWRERRVMIGGRLSKRRSRCTAPSYVVACGSIVRARVRVTYQVFNFLFRRIITNFTNAVKANVGIMRVSSFLSLYIRGRCGRFLSPSDRIGGGLGPPAGARRSIAGWRVRCALRAHGRVFCASFRCRVGTWFSLYVRYRYMNMSARC